MDTEISHTYNAGIEFATATLNGEEVEAVCDGSSVVTINYELQGDTEYVLVVDVLDAEFRELQTTLSFKTEKKIVVYHPENPTIEGIQTISEPVKITADAYTNDAPMRTFNNDTTIHDSCGVVYKVEFPDMEGKEFKNFIFRFGSWFYGGDSMRVMGLPADTDVANLSESDEPFASMWANEAAYKCNVGSVLGDNFYATLYHNYADITAYANECIKAGDDYMYIVVDSASTGKAFSSNLTDSSFIGWDMYPYYY